MSLSNIKYPIKYEPINVLCILVYINYQIVNSVVEICLYVYINGQVDIGCLSRRHFICYRVYHELICR
jgi:hypothetical protein